MFSNKIKMRCFSLIDIYFRFNEHLNPGPDQKEGCFAASGAVRVDSREVVVRIFPAAVNSTAPSNFHNKLLCEGALMEWIEVKITFSNQIWLRL